MSPFAASATIEASPEEVWAVLADCEGSATGFTTREVCSGPLSGLFGRSIPDLQPSFEQFVRGLKQRVERAR